MLLKSQEGYKMLVYTTKHKNTLKITKREDEKHKGENLYTFTLHKPKAHGEDIVILLSDIRLTSINYFKELFMRIY